jgi:hypothetical protein
MGVVTSTCLSPPIWSHYGTTAPTLTQVVVLFWAPSCPDSRVQIPRVVNELEAGGAMLRLPRLLPHAPHVEDTLRAGFPMTRVVGYVEDDDTPDSAISGFMNERLLRFPARAHPPHSPHSVSATGPQRSHVQVGRAKNDGRKAPYIRLVSAYRGVPWALLVDGATCTPTWSNGGFALNRFVPEGALDTRAEAQAAARSAPGGIAPGAFLVPCRRSRWLPASPSVQYALRRARTRREALPAITAAAAAASASAAPELGSPAPTHAPGKGTAMGDSAAVGARCMPASEPPAFSSEAAG